MQRGASRTARAPAKIVRPIVRNVLPRQRLFDGIGTGAGSRITWVAGPPGAGKTVLAATYVERRDAPCLWYQLDEGDADPATFFYYLGLAGRRAAPRRRHALPLLTPEYHAGLETFTRRYFEDLAARLPPGTVLVFDNYQDVPAASPLHDLFALALETLPATLPVLVLSRAEPPATLARLRAAGVLELLGWEQLRLTEAESLELLRLRTRGRRARDGKALHARAQGWAAGLVLLAEQEDESAQAAPLDGQEPQVVFDYLGHELFRRLAPAVRSFLLRTALLPYVGVEMAERLTGNRRAGRILTTLMRGNHFTVQHARSHRHFQYHPLFRAFLLAEARQRLRPAELSRLQAEAGRLLAEDGRVEEAAELLVAAEDWPALHDLIVRNAQDLLGQGRHRTLLGWLESLPPALRDADPWLACWEGAALMHSRLDECRSALNRAFQGFRQRGDAMGQYLSWCLIAESYVVDWNDMEQLDRWLPELDRLEREHPDAMDPPLQARFLLSRYWVEWFRRPEVLFREDGFTDKVEALQRDHPDMPNLLALRAIQETWLCQTGQYDRLDRLGLQPAWQLKTPDSPLAQLELLRVAATVEFYRMRPHVSVRLLESAFRIARRTGVHTNHRVMLGVAANAALLMRDNVAAERYVRELRALGPPPRGVMSALTEFVAAKLEVVQGQFESGRGYLTTAVQASVDAAVPTPTGMGRIGLALVASEQGDLAAALRELRLCFPILRRIGHRPLEDNAMLVRAGIALRRGRPRRAAHLLRRGMDRRTAYLEWWCPDWLARLAAFALQEGINPAFVHTLIARYGLTAPADAPPHWPWPVRVRALGPLEVEVDGAPLRFGRKAQRRPLALLKALIALGGRAVPTERLAAALWPDADGDRAAESLRATLARLRKLIGADAVRAVDGSLSLDTTRVWVDAFVFAEALRQGADDDADPDGPRVDAALALYRRPLLDGDFSLAEILSAREQLHSLFLRHVGRLGEVRLADGRHDEAIALYERGLAVDDLAESFYQGLMRSCLAAGRAAEGLAAYRRCRETLRAHLGIGPSPATEALARKLRGAQTGR